MAPDVQEKLQGNATQNDTSCYTGTGEVGGLIGSLAAVLEKSSCLDSFWGALDAGDDATLGVAASARPFLVAARFAHAPQATLVVVAGEDAAVSFARNVAAYVGEDRVLRFPERKDVPFVPQTPDPRVVARRMEAAYSLRTGRRVIVVASARSLVRMLAPPTAQADTPLSFAAGHDLGDMAAGNISELADVTRALEIRGYVNTGDLDGPGTFAVHGGIIDIFPGNLVYPVQLDFFGDTLEEIRRIVPSTGQTIASLESVEVFPVVEFTCSAQAVAHARRALKNIALTNAIMRDMLEKLDGGLRFDGSDALLPYLYDTTATLGDYTAPTVLTTLVEPRSLFDDAQRLYDDLAACAKGTSIPLKGLFVEPSHLNFGGGRRATYLSIMRAGGDVDDELPIKRTEVAGSPDKIYGRLRNLIDAGFVCVLSVPNHRAREDMGLTLVEHGLSIVDASEPDGDSTCPRLRRGVVNVVDVDVPIGMVIPKARLAIVSASDTQGSRTAVRSHKTVDVTEITFPYRPGEYVVHAVHGVAFFRDLVRREVDGSTRDYLQLEYADGDKLFVPVEQLDRVTRYVGPEGASPRLTRLNTSDWSRALSKARKATRKLAFDLVDVYARRAATQGYRFVVDTPWQSEMEDAFPYQETPDQLAAIADVKTDMASARPMDRLICGDVGFGKTEVALRAAFIAVQNHKQVMVLCPTTILAQQHYTSFKERFEPFGVKVEVLSRFRTPAEQKQALAGFADGTVNVLVGTHRLLSRDVNPHDLGLAIIDEEQRFGVGHKEQMKNLRETIDVLTMSATPIPRTMQMSLSGVRDMSLILTPPDDRLPVKVHVGEWDPDTVAAAIRLELARGGQVYYVSNRVRSIDDAVERVQAAAAEARVGVAHGQMGKEELESVMEDFAAGLLDVLVATTIIESGIDNPHTNTLIIEDSQRLGLAQMYQLKGRVGRSAVQAYAYFMFPENAVLTEEAASRLMAIDEHQDLGSGMRIALRDLEIRGAGSILGAEQSGNMSAVGFDLFAQMLAQAVNDAREGDDTSADGLPAALSDITVNIPGHAYLPDEYVPDVDERVLWYRKIASAVSTETVDSLCSDMEETHSGMPSAAHNLFEKARIKAFANEHHIKTVSLAEGKLTIEPVDISREASIALRRVGGRYSPDKHKLTVPERCFKHEEDDDIMAAVADFLKQMFTKEGSELSRRARSS